MSPLASLTIRPIGPEDRHALATAFERLSPESRRKRFLAPKDELTARELDYLTDVDHRTHEALVALDREGEIVAVARYATWTTRPCAADFAVTVADAWQGRGLGSALALRLVERARDHALTTLTATTLWENGGARRMLKRLGFQVSGHGGGLLDFELRLTPAVAAA
jgi:GNAT superfamily N-acetyltransferase